MVRSGQHVEAVNAARANPFFEAADIYRLTCRY